MKFSRRLNVLGLFVLAAFFFTSCSNNDDNHNNSDDNAGGSEGCYVHLYDGDNFKDDNFIVKGEGDYSDLSKLSGTDKDWNDEADSFKIGKNATVTMWTKTNFEGDSIVYKGGTEKASAEEPSSMKIKCN